MKQGRECFQQGGKVYFSAAGTGSADTIFVLSTGAV